MMYNMSPFGLLWDMSAWIHKSSDPACLAAPVFVQ